MNKIYKVIYSKAKHSFVVVSELAHSHTKPAAIAGTLTRRSLSALVLTALLMSVSPAAFAATENVVYDSDGKTITLENTDGNGTKVTNVADGFLAAASKDAVNGSQLYSTNLRITDIADALTKNNSTIAQAQTDITRVKTQNIKFNSDINTLKTQVSTGWNATIDGAKVKTVNPASNSLNFSAGDDISLVDPGNGSIKVSVAPTGAVADGDTHVVSGGTVYTAIQAEQTARTQADTDLSNKIGSLDNNGNYIQKDASVSSNLNTLDTHVKANADAIGQEKTDREAAITNITNNIGDLSNSAVKYDANTNKGKITLEGTSGTTITNVKDGALSDSSTDAVTGKQLFAEQTARTQADTDLSNKIGSLDNNGNYIQKDASVSSNLNTLDTHVKANADAIGQEKTDREAAITNVTNNLNSLSDSAVQYDKDTNKTKVTLAGASGTTLTNVKAGALSDSSTDAVNGSQLYAEQTARTQADTDLSNKIGTLDANGNYIQKDASVSSNLNTLDTHVKANADAIGQEKTDREAAITNITNNIGDLSNSAVKYDANTNKGKITLEGTSGTTITNVKDGALSDSSTDAVTGKQLFAEQTARTQADTDLSNKIGSLDNNGNYIQKDASVSSNLNTLDTHVKANADAIGQEKTDREAAITNITNNIGDLSNSAVKYDANTNKGKITLEGTSGTTITNVKDGALSDSSTDAVTGKQLFAEQTARTQADTDLSNKIGSLDNNGNYIQKDASVSSNLNTLDTHVKANADAIGQEKTDREAAITNVTNNLNSLSDSAVQYDKDTNKTKVTLAGASGTTLTNVKAGVLSDSSTEAVNGAQLYAEQQARIQAVTDINNTIGTLRGNAVLYDSDAKDLVTFGGSKGTRLTNLKDAALTATSTDAVTGRQLYTTNQNISGFADQIAKNAGKLESLATSVTNSLDSVSAMSESVTAIDNTKADASLNNLSADGLQVITNAANNAVQAYMKNLKSQPGTSGTQTGTQTGTSSSAPAKAAGTQTVSLASLSKMAVSPSSLFVSLAATGTPENVVYDSDGKTISLNNTDGNGTKIQYVADGFLGAGSQDAVNGRQLYATNLRITDIADALSKNNSTIAQAQTDITRVKTQNITFKSDINTLKTQVTTGWNATVNGAKLKTVNPSSNMLNFTDGDDIALTDAGNGSLKVAVKASGKVEAGNSHVVTGDAVYQAIKDMPTTGSLSGKANTALDNINDAGKTVIKDLAKDAIADSLATKANTDASNIDTDAFTKKLGTGTNAQGSTGLVTGDTLYNAVKDRAATDASNIDTEAYTKKLGTGTNEQGSTGLVTGDTLYNAVKDKADKSYVDEGLAKKADKDSVYTKDETYNRTEIDDKVQKVTQDLSGKADTDLKNITDVGKSVITDLAKGSVKVIAGKNTTVTEGTAKDGAKTYAVNVEDSAIQEAVQPQLDQKANVDASNLTKDNVASWQKALGTGAIDKDSTGLVTGQVVYQAIKDMPTGEGLVKYDSETKTITVAADKDATKVDFSGKDSDGNTINRTITGIVTDAKDATSAANVGYVQDVAGSLANGVQRVANQLSHDINKVGAGAAALAGLHPGEFDPDNKLDFAAGYGHYKGANAGALGAYYHPNEDTIISLAGTMGNGDPMLSAGVTFKLGPSGPNTLSRTALTKQVAKDQQTIKALAGELANVKDQLNRVLSLLDMSKKVPFSDVPADHWAKDAVDTLHGNGALKGYPDGKFHGDKAMTRYEYAEMLYEALQKGVHVDQATLNEYAPELSKVQQQHQ
jgi:hypothetical protein